MDEIIVTEILWADHARFGFDKIIAYLKTNWSDREIENFVKRIMKY